MSFYLGLFVGIIIFIILEPFFVNFIYFSNVALFFDIIVFKKNKQKFIEYFCGGCRYHDN